MTAQNKDGFHPRNLHNKRYDFPELIKSFPKLKPFVSKNSHGDLSVDYSDPQVVIVLNQALLCHFYNIENWNFPQGHLCPPIPGRVDYIHYIADLLAESNNGEVPKGKKVKGLDIGVGATCIYPILGHKSYGWKFIGSDINSNSINSSKNIIKENHSLKTYIKCRFQKNSDAIFEDIIKTDELFDFTLCNPPFHSSKQEASEGSERKNRNLNLTNKNKGKSKLNFGGHDLELWCPGGEMSFIKKMIEQSQSKASQCLWFTTLVSKKENLDQIYNELQVVNSVQVRTIDMIQGMKKTRIVAWTFLNEKEHENWRLKRW